MGVRIQGRFIFPRSGGLSLLPLGEGAAKRRMRARIQGRFIFPRAGGLSLLPLGEGAAKRRMRANRPGPGRPSPGLRPDPASGVPPAPRGRGFESPNPAKMKRPWEGIGPDFTRRRGPEPTLLGL